MKKDPEFNIWKEIWKRIEGHPERLFMGVYFTNKDGSFPSILEVDRKWCGSACCILGHAYLIGLERKMLRSFFNPDSVAGIMFGEELELRDGGRSKFGKLCYEASDRKAYNEVKRRALEC